MHEYQLRYLPQFDQELMEHACHIAKVLCNPDAADKLVDATEHAILERQPHAEAFEAYHSRKDREHPYYRIYVDNFIAFYVVISEGNQKIMEMRRFVYGKSNWKRSI